MVYHLTLFSTKDRPTGWWLNQLLWKIWSWNWIISLGIGVNIRNTWNHHLVSTSMIQIWWGPKRMIPKVVYPMKNERYPEGQDNELHSKRLCQHVWWCCYREIKIQFYPWWAKWKLPRRSWVCELVNCVSIAFGIIYIYIDIWVTCLPFNHSEFKSSFFLGEDPTSHEAVANEIVTSKKAS